VLSDSQRRLRARIGGLALAAKHDPRDYTAPGRAAFLARFLDEVDPQRELPEPERERRAVAARKRYFAQLALRSSRARRKPAA
jgi:hypothetical protein